MNTKGQNLLEYMLILTAVVGIAFVAMQKNGPAYEAAKGALDKSVAAINKGGEMIRNLNPQGEIIKGQTR